MLIAGIDEAGRGPAVGPMVMAVALISEEDEELLRNAGIKDSKLMSPKERERGLYEMRSILREFRSTQVSAKEIDKLRRRHSLNEIEAMKIGQLLNELDKKPEVVYIDCPDLVPENFIARLRKYLSFDTMLRVEHKADLNYPVVAAASVIAKVERDAAIMQLEMQHGKMGSGYCHDPDTIKFIKKYLKKHNKLPDFVRKSWITSQKLLDERFQKKLFE